jgi:hypothetical protein
MALFFLDYDLRARRDYQTLYDALKGFGAVRVLESTWCFRRTNTTAAGLRDYFKQYVDGDDAICVTQVEDWATYKTLGTPNDLK